METRLPVEGSFGNKFSSNYNHYGFMAASAWSRKTLTKIQIFEVLSRPRHQSTCCVQISWNLADGKSVKSCVVYVTKKQNFAWLSRYRYCADRAQNLLGPARECTQSISDSIQIGSLLVELFSNAWTTSKRAVKCFQYSAEAIASNQIIIKNPY